jgi:hypothetical protein
MTELKDISIFVTSFMDDPYFYLQVQHTPKPLAHDPAEVPPLLVHSELKVIEINSLYVKK